MIWIKFRLLRGEGQQIYRDTFWVGVGYVVGQIKVILEEAQSMKIPSRGSNDSNPPMKPPQNVPHLLIPTRETQHVIISHNTPETIAGMVIIIMMLFY